MAGMLIQVQSKRNLYDINISVSFPLSVLSSSLKRVPPYLEMIFLDNLKFPHQLVYLTWGMLLYEVIF